MQETQVRSLGREDPLEKEMAIHSSTLAWQSIALQVAQMVMRLPTMRETQVWSLGQEVPLEKEMATHSSIPAWRIPWTKESGWLQFMGSQRVGHDWATITFTFRLLSVQFSSVAQSCPTLCDPMNHSTPSLPVHLRLLRSPPFSGSHTLESNQNGVSPFQCLCRSESTLVTQNKHSYLVSFI